MLKEQNEFYDKVQMYLPDLKEKNIRVIGEILEIEKKRYESYEVFERFLKLDTSIDEGKQVLEDYQKRIYQLLQENNKKTLIDLFEPYHLFLTIAESNDASNITIEQETLLEATFRKPLPRLLYNGHIFFNEQRTLENLIEGQNTKVEVAETKVANNEKKEPSRFSFNTNKNKPFGAKEFRSLFKDLSDKFVTNILILLNGLCRFAILSDNQLKLISDNQTIIQGVLFKRLLRDGYLSTIIENETGNTFFVFPIRE